VRFSASNNIIIIIGVTMEDREETPYRYFPEMRTPPLILLYDTERCHFYCLFLWNLCKKIISYICIGM